MSCKWTQIRACRNDLQVGNRWCCSEFVQFHVKKSDIIKCLLPFSLLYLLNKESHANAAIIEMFPVACAKCASVTSDVDCLSDLVVLIFLTYLSWLSFWSIFWSLKEDMRKGQGVDSRFVFTGNKTSKWLKIFW